MTNFRALIALGMLTTLAACSTTTYYQVKDPTTGNVYYATELDKGSVSGAITLEDAGSGATVTLQTSEVMEVSEAIFMSNAYREDPAPAPAATPAQ